MKHNDKIRGGRGTKGDPVEIQRVLDDMKKDDLRTSRDIEKLKQDKDRLLVDLASLRTNEAQAQDKDFSSTTKKHIAGAITYIQKKLSELNGVLPEVDPSVDHAKIQEILKKYHDGEHAQKQARAHLAKAEHVLEKLPADTRALGDANRARAEILESSTEIVEAIKQAEFIEANVLPSPAHDDSISYTHKQYEVDLAQRKQLGIDTISENSVDVPTPVEPEMPLLDSIPSIIVAQELAIPLLSAPVEELSITEPEEAPEEHNFPLVIDSGADLPLIVPVDFSQVPRVVENVTEFSAENIAHREAPEIAVEQIVTPVSADHTTETIPKETNHDGTPPPKEPFRVIPKFDPLGALTFLANFFYKKTKSASVALLAFLGCYAHKETKSLRHSKKSSKHKDVHNIFQIASSKIFGFYRKHFSVESIAQTEAQIHEAAKERWLNHIKKMFPQKGGFLGYGGTRAGTIPDELLNKTAKEILNTEDFSSGSAGENMKNYLKFSIKSTGVHPLENEDAREFGVRAITHSFTKHRASQNTN